MALPFGLKRPFLDAVFLTVRRTDFMDTVLAAVGGSVYGFIEELFRND